LDFLVPETDPFECGFGAVGCLACTARESSFTSAPLFLVPGQAALQAAL
jgi:hypothetical protein